MGSVLYNNIMILFFPLQLLLLQVELPKSEHTVVRVSPTILMGALLCYICGKRNLNPAHHRFDLPVTEESLAQRSLQQLRISSIRIIAKGQRWCFSYVQFVRGEGGR
jgi:hypothetical protein